MTSHVRHRHRWRTDPDDLFYGTVTVTGLLAYIGYGILLLPIAGGH